MKAKKRARLYDVRREGITQSLLSRWLECREKARLYAAERLSTKLGSAAMFGILFHGVLERVYKSGRSYPMREIREAVAELRDELPSPISVELEQTIEDYAAVIKVMLPHYIKTWAEDFDGSREWLGVEEVFSVPSPSSHGSDVPLMGKIDGWFEAGPKSLWLFETKTKGQIPSNLDESIPLDLQVHFYLYALAQLTGRKPRGVLYNVIRRPGFRATGEALVEKVRVDVAKRPEHYFQRWEVAIAADEMNRFEEALAAMVTEFVGWADGLLPNYRNGSACVSRWTCGYLRLCGSGRADGLTIRNVQHKELTT